MKVAEKPMNEKDRLLALNNYALLDTGPEQEFDDITLIASQICDTPISLISLVDENRQWFKSRKGMWVNETDRDFSFCAHAILKPDDVLVVSDSREDERFADNPLVTGDPQIIFYAGVPLSTPSGMPLGSLCVIDNKPRELSKGQLEALKSLSRQVVKLLEYKRLNEQLRANRAEMESKNQNLKEFAYVVAHDIKSPLNSINGLSSQLKSLVKDNCDEEIQTVVEHLSNSGQKVTRLVEGIIHHYLALNSITENKTEIKSANLFQEVLAMVDPLHEFNIQFESATTFIYSNETALQQILVNLISNGIKYNNKEEVKIEVNCDLTETHYRFVVKDNGTGISAEDYDKIFEDFSTLGHKDRFNKLGSGIGLATVKKLIDKLGGTIRVNSELGKGSEFTFEVKR